MKSCRIWTCLIALVLAGVVGACGKTHRRFPDTETGWHSPSYDKIFGRLQRVPAHKEGEKPYWIIRYASSIGPDIYGGKMVLTPESMMIGYAGEEMVELNGHVRPEMKNDAGTGMIYEVTAIRLWVGHISQ